MGPGTRRARGRLLAQGRAGGARWLRPRLPWCCSQASSLAAMHVRLRRAEPPWAGGWQLQASFCTVTAPCGPPARCCMFTAPRAAPLPAAPPTGTCYLLLSSLAFNFVRGVFVPELQKRCTWSHSAWTKFVDSTNNTAVAAAASLHDTYLHGLDPLRTLEVRGTAKGGGRRACNVPVAGSQLPAARRLTRCDAPACAPPACRWASRCGACRCWAVPWTR
jgi:hypothetical protein